MIKHIV